MTNNYCGRSGVVLLRSYFRDKCVNSFPNGICLKVNVMARLEFELAYFEETVRTLTITPR